MPPADRGESLMCQDQDLSASLLSYTTTRPFELELDEPILFCSAVQKNGSLFYHPCLYVQPPRVFLFIPNQVLLWHMGLFNESAMGHVAVVFFLY